MDNWVPLVTVVVTLSGVTIFFLRGVVNQHFKDYDRLTKENADLRERQDALEERGEKGQEAYEKIQREHDALKKDHDGLKKEREEDRQKLNDALARAERESAARLQAETALDGEKKSKAELEGELTLFKQQIQTVQRELQQIKLDRDGERRLREQVEHERDELRTAMQRQIDTLKDEIEQLKAQAKAAPPAPHSGDSPEPEKPS